MPHQVLSCHFCGTTVELQRGEKIQRLDSCSTCNRDLHSCLHCRFYDPGRNNQCTEPEAEWVSDKESSNFCGYFEPSSSLNRMKSGGANRSVDARSAFDDLFKK